MGFNWPGRGHAVIFFGGGRIGLFQCAKAASRWFRGHRMGTYLAQYLCYVAYIGQVVHGSGEVTHIYEVLIKIKLIIYMFINLSIQLLFGC